MGQSAQLRALPMVRGARADDVDVPLPMRVGDVVLTAWCTLVAVWLWTGGAWAPGARSSAVAYTIMALGPVVCRALAFHVQKLRFVHHIANFWLLPVMVFGHCNFTPFLDSVNPRLFDLQLARMDQMLFGATPSLYSEGHIPPVAMDVFLLCYYTFFLWPMLLAVVLYFKNRAAFTEFRVAMICFFVANFILYVAVPAVGPRFFLANAYQGPLHGFLLTPLLDGAMRVTPFNRDCFPSGHTGFTLVVLFFAFSYARRFFWVMLPVAMGLIAATILGRFHYGIDLICSVPLVLVVISTATFLSKAQAYAPEPARKLAMLIRRAAANFGQTR